MEVSEEKGEKGNSEEAEPVFVASFPLFPVLFSPSFLIFPLPSFLLHPPPSFSILTHTTSRAGLARHPGSLHGRPFRGLLCGASPLSPFPSLFPPLSFRLSSSLSRSSALAVYDGHGGKEAADMASCELHRCLGLRCCVRSKGCSTRGWSESRLVAPASTSSLSQARTQRLLSDFDVWLLSSRCWLVALDHSFDLLTAHLTFDPGPGSWRWSWSRGRTAPCARASSRRTSAWTTGAVKRQRSTVKPAVKRQQSAVKREVKRQTAALVRGTGKGRGMRAISQQPERRSETRKATCSAKPQTKVNKAQRRPKSTRLRAYR
eukprot:2787947-Rhodomonas_salina.1